MTLEWLRALIDSVGVSPASHSETTCDMPTCDDDGHAQPATAVASHLSHPSHESTQEIDDCAADGALPLVACVDCRHFDWRPYARPDAYCGAHAVAISSKELRECAAFERPGIERPLWDTSCGACIHFVGDATGASNLGGCAVNAWKGSERSDGRDAPRPHRTRARYCGRWESPIRHPPPARER